MELTPKIIFEDSTIVAFDKPSGLVVNRSNTHSGITLQDFAEEQMDFEDEGDESDFQTRSGILHRLDKDTSGVILMAKDPEVFVHIQKQFKDRKIAKQYAAILLNSLLEPLMEIDAPIKRNPRMSFKFAISPEGRASQTRIERVKNFENNAISYVSVLVSPKTGRTHQIRVHCAAIYHPIAGDPIYCTSKECENSSLVFPRLMLHALSIEFVHPITNTKILLNSPLPDEFKPFS